MSSASSQHENVENRDILQSVWRVILYSAGLSWTFKVKIRIETKQKALNNYKHQLVTVPTF